MRNVLITHQPPLASGSGESTVQDGRAHVYKATHGTAPSYLSQLVRVADLPGRRSLRSAWTNRLLVPSVKVSTVGGRAFPVTGPAIWNSLPDNVISAPSLSTFRQHLTRSSAIAEGPRDASCQLKFCQLPRNNAETTCTTSPERSISCR